MHETMSATYRLGNCWLARWQLKLPEAGCDLSNVSQHDTTTQGSKHPKIGIEPQGTFCLGGMQFGGASCAALQFPACDAQSCGFQTFTKQRDDALAKKP